MLLLFLIYLAVLGLICGMQDLLVLACGIQLPDQGLNPGPPALGASSLSHWTTSQVLKYLLNGSMKGNSLVVQGLGLHACTAGGMVSIPGWGTKRPLKVHGVA